MRNHQVGTPQWLARWQGVVPIVVVTVPLLFGIGSLLPDIMQSQLAVRYGMSHSVTAWAAPLIHTDLGHLGGNCVAYCVTASVGYALYHRAGIHRMYWRAMAALIVLVPLITTGVEYWLYVRWWAIATPGTTAVGDSDIVSTVIGVAVIGIGLVTKQSYHSRVARAVLLVAALLGVGALAVSVEAMGPSIGMVWGSGLFLLGRELHSGARESLDGLPRTAGSVHLLLLTAVSIVTILLVAMVPVPAGADGQILNVLAHVSGFLLGGGIAIVAVLTTHRN